MGRRWYTSRVFRLLVLIGAAWLASFTSTSSRAQNTAFDLAGKPADPLKSGGAQVIVLVFVRTDCPVSNRYAPTIQRLSAEHAGKATFGWFTPVNRNRQKRYASMSANTATKFRHCAIHNMCL